MLTARTMIILSAVAATGIVFLSEPSHSEQTVGVEHAKYQDRHPAFHVGDALRGALAAERSGQTIEAPTSTPKSDRLNVVNGCDGYTWPKFPASCLTIAGNDEMKAATRQIVINERPSDRLTIVTAASTIVARY